MNNGKSIEQRVFEIKFPEEVFNPNDYNDWAKENSEEAYNILLTIAKIVSNDLRNLSKDRDGLIDIVKECESLLGWIRQGKEFGHDHKYTVNLHDRIQKILK